MKYIIIILIFIVTLFYFQATGDVLGAVDDGLELKSFGRTRGLLRVFDKEKNVLCYLTGSTGISCLKIE